MLRPSHFSDIGRVKRNGPEVVTARGSFLWGPDVAEVANLKHGQKKSDPPIGVSGVSQGEAAKMMKVGQRTVQRATKIRRHAAAGTVEAVKRADLSLDGAEALAKESPEEQERIVSLPKNERAEELRRKRGKSKKRVEQGQQEVVADPETVSVQKSLIEQFHSGVDSMLTMIQESRARGWSDLPLEIITEGLEKLRAAVTAGHVTPTDASASADDYASSIPDGAEETIGQSETVVTTVADPPPGEVELAEDVTVEDASMEIQEANADEQRQPIGHVEPSEARNPLDGTRMTVPAPAMPLTSETDSLSEMDLAGQTAMDDESSWVSDADDVERIPRVENAETGSVGQPSCFGKPLDKDTDKSKCESCECYMECNYKLTGKIPSDETLQYARARRSRDKNAA